MDDNIRLMLPPYLQELGYCNVKSIQLFSEKCFEKGPGNWHPYFVEWRGIFDYLACVEYAYQSINQLPKGVKILEDYNLNQVQAKYHSASLVFFLKATLDNIAVWLKKQYSLTVNGANISLSKELFQNRIVLANPSYQQFFDKYKEFLGMLDKYRMEWIHRIIGGAVIGGDKRPGDPSLTDDNIGIIVPMGASLNFSSSDIEGLHKKIEEVKERNDGEYLYKVEDFICLFVNETKKMIFDILELSLPLFEEKSY
ncbi:hypothetical protein [Priestia filamentosa]|uniref:hypothetical protein n=1 Tax=Priestia filamentosa TaxID=1402861 RepID=UPI000A088CC8|nr:hypothetical protein [Priestia filamentosa]MDT3762956.1 hypothetical protein [Priestia filamentosa]OXS69478.1 hypothetical protein B1B01_10950 [Priestia filamentosa]WRU97397.1 hypothetical protein RYX51_10105 [Priestia filamentosa]SMF33080.1 hypothetical protein SAMN06296056_102762 [Priestia filamentosa]